MQIDKLTNQLQVAISEAQSIAVGKDHLEVDGLHLLQALLDQPKGTAKSVLRQAGFDLQELQNALEQKN